jgi:hypothetical protein
LSFLLLRGVLARFFFKEAVQIAAFLVRAKKGNGDFPTRADLAFEAQSDFS